MEVVATRPRLMYEFMGQGVKTVFFVIRSEVTLQAVDNQNI